MNKKGFTLVEVIVSVVLVSVIMVSMLASLVKLRDTYTVIHENSDVIVYTSSIARVINNDLMKNNGIRYSSCTMDGRKCELILGNDSKRRIDILEEGAEVDLGDYSNKNIIHERITTTLRYTDTTKAENEDIGNLIYIRTLTLDKYTNTKTDVVTTEGYNFYDMSSPDQKLYYQNGTNYVDAITILNIRIWDGKSSDSTKYDIALYTSGRYDESGLVGKTYKVELDTNGAHESGTLEIDEVFGVAYFNSEKSHSTSNIIRTIEIPKKKDENGVQMAFLGYYYYKVGDTIGSQVIDSTGRIVASSRHFRNDIVLSEEEIGSYERVSALWGACTNGYEVNAQGECVPKEYIVTLDKNGGSGGIDNYKAKYKAYVPTLSRLQLPTKQGYTFNGYYYGGIEYHDPNGIGKVMYEHQTGITLKAEWTARNDTKYTVKHYKEKCDGTYDTPDVEELQGTTDTEIDVPRKTYPGYEQPDVQRKTILADGSMVCEYYYKREKHTVTVNKGIGISSVSGGGTYKYGCNYTLNATVQAGYTWANYTGSSTITSQNPTLTMQTENVTYTANAGDKTKPSVKVTAYRYASSGNHVGDEIKGISSFTNDGTYTVSDNWLNHGVTFKIESSDSGSGIEKIVWKWNVTGNTSDTGNSYNGTESPATYTSDFATKYPAFTGKGYRKGQWVVTDKSGNATTITIVVKLGNARIDLDSNDGNASGGNNPIYVTRGISNIYTGRFNSTNATVPTMSRNGWSFAGWYTAASGGTKVIDASGAIQNNVSNWTDASGNWILTNAENASGTNKLYAHWTGNTYTATFNKNGATSIGSTSLSCTVSSGSSCTVTAPSITRSGFNIDGWSTTSTATSGTAVGNNLSLSANTSYYAITHKGVTVTFNKNSNTSQTPSGGSANTDTSLTQSCTIRNNNTSCSITSPTINPPTGFTAIGYSTAAGTHTSAWNQATTNSVSSNATYYAQSSKAASKITITFNVNGNGGSNSTKECTPTTGYNGTAPGTSCTIKSPDITPASGKEKVGWNTNKNATTSSWNVNTDKSVDSSTAKTWYAISKSSITDKPWPGDTITGDPVCGYKYRNNTVYTYCHDIYIIPHLTWSGSYDAETNSSTINVNFWYTFDIKGSWGLYNGRYYVGGAANNTNSGIYLNGTRTVGMYYSNGYWGVYKSDKLRTESDGNPTKCYLYNNDNPDGYTYTFTVNHNATTHIGTFSVGIHSNALTQRLANPSSPNADVFESVAISTDTITLDPTN